MLPDGRNLCEPTALRSVSMPAATPGLTPEQISAIDAAHLWHPYSTIGSESVAPVVAVGARGAWLTLVRDGKPIEVLDAMSSWWTAIHGHGHPVLDAALATQLRAMNHVMFGGLTHEPAARLAQLLVEITPAGLETGFFSDSGSVSVEVAVKMARQYWRSPRPPRQAPADDLAGRLPRRHLHADEHLRSRWRHAFTVDRHPGPASVRPAGATGPRPRL